LTEAKNECGNICTVNSSPAGLANHPMKVFLVQGFCDVEAHSDVEGENGSPNINRLSDSSWGYVSIHRLPILNRYFCV